MVAFAAAARNACENVLSAFLFADLAVGALSGAFGCRMANRRLAARRQRKERQAFILDTRCRCRGLLHLTGPDSRAYVHQHLEAEPDPPQGIPAQVRRCVLTGSRFLDFPAVPVWKGRGLFREGRIVAADVAVFRGQHRRGHGVAAGDLPGCAADGHPGGQARRPSVGTGLGLVFPVLSVAAGTMHGMPRRTAKTGPTLSGTGVPLTREVAFKFALDPTSTQEQQLLMHAGAARFAFNHHIARVRANRAQRDAERSYGIGDERLTPALSWSEFSFIGEFNDYKNGKLASSPTSENGVSGLAWRSDVSADVFEGASVDAARAFGNWSASRRSARKGRPVGFPGFKARGKTSPAFRLRNRAKPGTTQAIRVAGPKALILPSIRSIRVHGCTRKVRRMLQTGRLHLSSATIRKEKGRWWAKVPLRTQ
jgi:hypothetical protein